MELQRERQVKRTSSNNDCLFLMTVDIHTDIELHTVICFVIIFLANH